VTHHFVGCPGLEYYFDHELRSHSMDLAQFERPAEMAAFRRLLRKQHPVNRERLELAPDALQLGIGEARAKRARRTRVCRPGCSSRGEATRGGSGFPPDRSNRPR